MFEFVLSLSRRHILLALECKGGRELDCKTISLSRLVKAVHMPLLNHSIIRINNYMKVQSERILLLNWLICFKGTIKKNSFEHAKVIIGHNNWVIAQS